MESRTTPRLLVRLPPDVKTWLASEATRNASSQTSEVVRALRERMEHHAALRQGSDHDDE
jgi:hypothetical protein